MGKVEVSNRKVGIKVWNSTERSDPKRNFCHGYEEDHLEREKKRI